MSDLVRPRRAIVSVSDKAGLVPFVQALERRGVEIISTGGTASTLQAAGIHVTPIDAVTGFPEILSGRVKTLHPKVHGGLLGLRNDPAHVQQMRQHAIEPIDLVCVNLYPFEATVARGAAFEETIENIDIGGPSMIRSAAKNFEFVAVVTSPDQYARVTADLDAHDGATTHALRADLAAQAFARTARYDAAIASYLLGRAGESLPTYFGSTWKRAASLRYGENPHQPAALYRLAGVGEEPDGSVARARQLHGKELSYNNILDASAALELAWALSRCEPGRTRPGAVVVKHTNPCGAALAPTAAHAVEQAIASDPLAAYGGILALNTELDEPAANRLTDKSIFLEVIIAPSFTPGAVDILKAKSANVRLLACGGASPSAPAIESRSIPSGLLVQGRDTRLIARAELVHAAGPAPTAEQLDAALFLEPVARALLSNAVLIGGRPAGAPDGVYRSFGAGAGQMDRVTACRIAVEKAGDHAQGAIAFSDAFFPFADGPRILIDAGVKVLVHPGGSKRDQDTFDLCAQRGVTCLTTGVRHFRH